MLWDILIWIFVGAIAGILADLVVKRIRLGLLGKIIVGILGGLGGGYLWNQFTGLDLGFAGKIIAAFIGAVILLLILRLFRSQK
jgi:uncharacterized membrane protein YeaQ/YmgE (transglycosylase-associated protein family)